MPEVEEVKKFTTDQVIHIINETYTKIWEDEAIDNNIDYKTMLYVIGKIKSVFIDID